MAVRSFSLFLALKYLRPRRTVLSVVTVISVVGVLLGVAILVIVLSVMTGFDTMWREKILSFKPHLTVTGAAGTIADEETVCRMLDEVPGVTGVAPALETLVLVQSQGNLAAPILLGVDPDRVTRVSRVGQHLVMGALDLEGDRVVVGIDLAGRLGLEVGSVLVVYSPLNVVRKDEVQLPRELTVSGIFNLGMRDFDAGFILTSLDVARDLTGMARGARSVYVMTEDPFRFKTFVHRVTSALGPGYHVRSWAEVDSLLFEALSHEKTMMFLLLVFITIVAIFCVTNTLIVMTVEKTSEIGLLKALGFPTRRIMAVFVWHGWIQCLVGTGAGIGLGLLVLHNLRRIARWLLIFDIEVFPKEIYGLSEIPWATSVGELTRIAAVVLGFCTVASLLPAYRAARLDPVEALRHE